MQSEKLQEEKIDKVNLSLRNFREQLKGKRVKYLL